MILALLCLTLSIACFSIRELYYHGKLKWMKDDASFWGERSHYRKYANPLDEPKNNWYYKFFRIGYKERFLGSATVFVALTDAPHMLQFFLFIFLSLSISIALELNWKGYLMVWIGVHGIHFLTYKFLQR